MKTFIVVLFFMLSVGLSGNSLAQKTQDIFTVTVYESLDPGYNKIFVYENEKMLEEIPLKPITYKDLGAHQSEINKVLLKYNDAGYRIISEVRGGFTVNSIYSVMVTTYRLDTKP